jgi:hypothetical protein
LGSNVQLLLLRRKRPDGKIHLEQAMHSTPLQVDWKAPGQLLQPNGATTILRTYSDSNGN